MRALKIFFKSLGVLFLIWLSMHAWNIFSPAFLPGPEPEMRRFADVQSELEGLAEARRAGPEAEAAYREQLERSRVFDNSLLINYVLPLFLVWLVCAIAQAREISPLSLVGGLTPLWLSAYYLFQLATGAIDLVTPHMGPLGEVLRDALPRLSEKAQWQLGGLSVALLLVLIRRAPGLLTNLVLYLPRRFERALTDLQDEEHGWLARRHGAWAAEVGHGLAILFLVGDAAWILWRVCDGVDGGGVPGLFGLAVRAHVVLFGIFLLLRGHLRAVQMPAH